jgi:uncharacterized protein (TIGR03089 family)
VTELISQVLRHRVRERGGDPLITYYDLGSGERTELSAVTVGNWVDKTSNLLVNELLLEPGEPVELALAASHPGHWVTFIWQLACWQVGAVVTLEHGPSAAVLVAGPASGWTAGPTTQVLLCSLHPLGLGLALPPDPPALDYAVEVRSQPDQHAAMPQSGLAVAWLAPAVRRTQAELVDPAYASAARRLIRAGEPWPTTRDALLAPLIGGGSTVLVVGDLDDERLTAIAAQEKAEHSD